MEPNDNNSDEKIRPLRTYEDDVSQMVQDDGLTTTKIVLAEEEKRRAQGIEENPQPPKNKNHTKIIIAAVLIILGLGFIIVAFKYGLMPQQITNLISNGNKQTEIIPRKSAIKIFTDGKDGYNVEKEIVDKVLEIENGSGEIIGFEIVKTETVEDEKGNQRSFETNITTRNFFEMIRSNANDRLIRSMEDIFLFGAYTGPENIPFLILKTSDIDLSFAEVYQWESRMYDDLKNILLLKNEVPEFIEVATTTINNNATTTETSNESTAIVSIDESNETVSTTTKPTATTTTQLIKNPEPRFDPIEFTDVVISNRDSRAILDESGQVILIYSFVDDENIVFTKDINVFQEIVRKLLSTMLVR